MLPSNRNPVLKIPKMLSPSLSLRTLLGNSSVARLLRQLLWRMAKLTIGVQALAIRKLVCGLFTSPEPVMPPLPNVPQEHLRQMSQHKSGTPPAWGNKGKNKFKAHLAQALANHNTFGDDTSDTHQGDHGQVRMKVHLWISICRPIFIGLILLFWSIYYYPPPPILLYLVRIISLTSTNPHLILVALFLYWIYPYWPPPKVTTSSNYQVSWSTYLPRHILSTTSILPSIVSYTATSSFLLV